MARFKILDGGAGSELQSLGYNVNYDPLWSARLLHTNPEAIKKLHKSFLEAGSNIIITVTYQASVAGFIEHLGVSEDRAKELIKLGVHLAKEACKETNKEGSALVAGSLGPYGAYLHDGSEYTGTYVETMTKQELMNWHRPQVEALIEGGVDLLAIETIPALKEAEAVLEVLEEFSNSKAYVTFSCKDGKHTCHGDIFCGAMETVCQSDHVVAAGINCTHPSHVSDLLDTLNRENIVKPTIVKPNSGEPWECGKGWVGRGEQSPLQPYLSDWIKRGATWIGGCCRITPRDIKDLKKFLDSL